MSLSTFQGFPLQTTGSLHCTNVVQLFLAVPVGWKACESEGREQLGCSVILQEQIRGGFRHRLA